jgi:soluble lytic murein transglycosylase-like protein
MRIGAKFIVVMGAVAAMALSAHAAERVILRNGFSMPCNHHAEADGRVRLYTTPGEESYVELAPEEIAEVETVPDPVVESRPALAVEARREAKLSETDLGEMLSDAGRAHNVDVDLLASLVKAESGGNARAVSRTGARGLMQLMPRTATDLGVEDSFKPEENVRGGSTYIDSLLTRYHDNLALALAAYNAGPAAVDRYHGIPPYRETRAYVARVIHEFNKRVRAREAMERRTVAGVRSSEGSR